MTGWQAERFVTEHQTEVIDVVSTLGRFSGRTCGVRFDREQRRFVLPLHESRGQCRRIPVNAILELQAMGQGT